MKVAVPRNAPPSEEDRLIANCLHQLLTFEPSGQQVHPPPSPPAVVQFLIMYAWCTPQPHRSNLQSGRASGGASADGGVGGAAAAAAAPGALSEDDLAGIYTDAEAGSAGLASGLEPVAVPPLWPHCSLCCTPRCLMLHVRAESDSASAALGLQVAAPAGLVCELRGYQQQALSWMLKKERGDDPGEGTAAAVRNLLRRRLLLLQLSRLHSPSVLPLPSHAADGSATGRKAAAMNPLFTIHKLADSTPVTCLTTLYALTHSLSHTHRCAVHRLCWPNDRSLRMFWCVFRCTTRNSPGSYR